MTVLLFLTACPPHDARIAAGDTGHTDTADGHDSGSQTETGDSQETGDADTSSATTVVVEYSLWTAETNCWTGSSGVFDAAWWWPYGEESGAECDDIAWYLADGDRCLVFARWCPDVEAHLDPAFSRTPEQDERCRVVWDAGSSIPPCPT